MIDLNSIRVDQLSRDEKLRLFDLLEEQERRARDRRENYRPNEGQLPVHRSDKQVRCVFSGNGSGKTALGVNEALWAANGFNPVRNIFSAVPARVVVVLSHPDKVAQNWLPEIRKWFNLDEKQEHKHGKPYVNELTFGTSSNITFMFHEQSEQAFESIEVDCVIFDEPPPRHVWIGLRRGGRKKHRKSWYLFIGTPLQAPWMYTDFYEPWSEGRAPNVECFQYDTDVNEKNLADNYKDEFGQFLSEDERRVRFGGEFYHLKGLPLRHLWGDKTHIISRSEFKKRWVESNPCVIAIDPHPNKEHVACLVGVDKAGQLYYIKEYASREVPVDFGNSLKRWYSGYCVIDIVIDSLAKTQLTGGDGNRSFYDVLREDCKIPLRSTSFDDKKEESWITRIQSVLAVPIQPDNFGNRIPGILVVSDDPMRDNSGIIKDIKTVSWVKVRNEELFRERLEIKNKDRLACLKYALASNLSYEKAKAIVFNHRPVTTYGQAPSQPQKVKQMARSHSVMKLRPMTAGRRPKRRFEQDEDW